MRKLVAPLMTTLLLGAFYSSPALAYIGPGAGITLLGALWGVVVAIALAIGAVLLWPLRILVRRRRNRVAGAASKRMADASESHASKASESEQATATPQGTPASVE